MSDEGERGHGSSSDSVPKVEVTEAHVLGYIILKGEPAWKELSRQAGEDILGLFYNTSNRAIARAILRMVEEGRPLTESALDDQLTSQHAVLSGDNRDVIVGLMTSTGIDTRKSYMAAIRDLAEYRTRRDILRGLDSLRSQISDESINSNAASSELKSIGITSTTARELPTFASLIEEMENQETAPWHISTGIEEFDKALGGGFKPGSNIVIGARPKIGKTTLLNNFCINALDEGAAVLLLSLEMQRPQIYAALMSCYMGLDRTVCLSFAEGRTNLKQVRSEHGEEFASDLSEARQFLMDSPLKVAFAEHLTGGDAISTAEGYMASMVAQFENQKVLVGADYLQLFSSNAFRSREEITGITRRLKLSAMELNVPVVYLSQLNRDSDGEMPRASQLRESGSIEQDADAVVMLNRKHFYNQEEPSHLMDVSIELNRMGPQSHFQLYWNGERNLIESLSGALPGGDSEDDFDEEFDE